MEAVILASGDAPPPWGDRAAEWPVLLDSASTWTTKALEAAGVRARRAGEAGAEPPAKPPVLVLPDNLLLTAEFLTDFLAAAATREGTDPICAAIGPGIEASRSAGRSLLDPLEDGALPVPLLLVRDGRALPADPDALLEACAAAEKVAVDPKDMTYDLPMPRAYAEEGKDTRTVGGSDRLAIHLRHRTHLLQANFELLAAHFIRVFRKPKWLLGLAFLWEWLTHRRSRLFTRKGRGCKIHPTAIVEASRLGRGCQIGAYAVVRACVLGDGAVIEDGAHVHISVIGPGARVGRQTFHMAMVLMEGAHAAQPGAQFTTLGRHAATTTASWCMDIRFQGNVLVPDRGRLVDSGFYALGCDLGHETILGAGVITAPGRMLPSRAVIASEPSRFLTRLPKDIDALDAGGATLIVKDGTLVPSDS